MTDTLKKSKTETCMHRHRVWIWGLLSLLVISGLAVWVMYDAGMIGVNRVNVVADTVAESAVDTANQGVQEIRPACAVVEDILLKYIVDDDSSSYNDQEYSAKVYDVLATNGCPENAQLFKDLATRKQIIADGLRALDSERYGEITSAQYLHSDEKICQTIENRVLQNIHTNAYNYSEFLDNANTYATLFEFGCKDNKLAFSRAAIRELGVALALQAPENMQQQEIITIIETYKRLGVANLGHLVVQRLKARGYDTEFLIGIEDIIHGLR